MAADRTGTDEALQGIKSHVARALHADLAECADAEVRWHVRLVDTPEHRAAVGAVARAHATRPAGTAAADVPL